MPERAAPPATSDDEGLRRDVGFFGLLWVSAGTTLGSGWLFGAFVALTIAGPAALLGWLVAACFMAPLALVYAELGAMFPESGGPGRFAHHAFGSLAGATFGWFAYVQAVTIAPIEVLAAIQYLSTNSWAHGLYHADSSTLSGTGYLTAIALMGAFVALNLSGIRRLAETNAALTVFKLAVPVLVAGALMATAFHAANFTAANGFFGAGGSTTAASMLTAIAAGGIAFSLMGFEGALQIGGESAHPQRDLPRAVFGAFVVCTLIYVAVQVAFIGALPPARVDRLSDWSALAHDPPLARAPFLAMTALAGLTWLGWILRVDAVASPSGTGLLYLTGASRLSFGLSRDGFLPRVFLTEDRERVPLWGVVFSAGLGLLFLLPFPSWNKLVSVVTGAMVLMYAAAPLALGSLRRTRPDLPRPYRLPAAGLLAPVSFVFATLVAYWSGWQTISTLMIALLLGYGVMAATRRLHLAVERAPMRWASARWLLPYLGGLTLISYLGNFGPGPVFGGIGPFATVAPGGGGVIPLWWDLAAVAVLSSAVYAGAMAEQPGAVAGSPTSGAARGSTGP